MTTLLALAERIERAEGPDRELDALIFCAVKGLPSSFGRGRDGEPSSIHPRFTGSFDAAVSLVPLVDTEDGPRRADYILEHVNGGLTIGARVGHNDPDRTSWGATDAHAMSAAALRARAAMEAAS